ncbi:MAG: hypothetical protein IJ418_19940 [Clostridia bacterium]|nr:hypothetical protein [Clostridia bacterium]
MQAQARRQRMASEETVLAFKRHILESSSGFAHEPMADAFRVSLLSQMLDRYDELQAKGMGELSCRNRVIYELDDIAVQMRDMGFEETDSFDDEATLSRWPQLTQQEAECYIRERDAYMHKTALGVFMCVACLAPMMVFAALSEVFWLAEEFFIMFGLVGMFAMIGMGVYAMVTAVKPKNEKRIKKKKFSLTGSLRRKLAQMRESIEGKARKRKGRGVALCVMSVIPVIVGAMMSEMFYSDVWPMLGIAGMFMMIGAGVYELVMADGEKTTMKRLLGGEKEE